MLLIIESPNKIKKIKTFLPSAQILATVGHFRDLPEGELGVDLATYAPTFVTSADKKDRVKQIREAAKGQDVYIATDPDREGFAIGTHVFEEVAKVAKRVFRAEIFEITKKGVEDAIKKAVPWSATNTGLYHAFLGRRVGDRIVGYIMSPIAKGAIRKQLEEGAKISVGRVQSPAVRLVVEREREIRNFKPTPFWTLKISLEKGIESFKASHAAGNFTNKVLADAALIAVKSQTSATIVKVETKEARQNPKAPFTTVEMQATASSQLGISPENSMKLAQSLFEAGLISYHRTDSVRIAPEFIDEIRDHVNKTLGPAYLPPSPVQYKSKNSQADAHEAIRPTHLQSAAEIPGLISANNLGADHERLYRLIYYRTIASQMAPAVFDATTVELICGGEPFKATGRVQKFDGFLAVYKEKDEAEKDDLEDLQKLPALVAGEVVAKTAEELAAKTTKAPGRYTEAALVKMLEKHGIGRPSTYASIMGTIKTRNYIQLVKGKIHASATGELLYDYLAGSHPWVIDLGLTRTMEEYLDKVEDGSGNWTAFVKGVHAKMNYAVPAAKTADQAPSEKALKYGEDLAKKAGKTLPAECTTSAFALRKWINKELGGAAAPVKGKTAKPARKAA